MVVLLSVGLLCVFLKGGNKEKDTDKSLTTATTYKTEVEKKINEEIDRLETENTEGWKKAYLDLLNDYYCETEEEAAAILAAEEKVAELESIFGDPEFLSGVVSGDVRSAISAAMSVMEKPWIMLISLFATLATTVVCIVYCCKIEKRSMASMGLRKSGWLGRYLKGFAIGTAMLLLSALVLWLMGDLDFAFAERVPLLYLLAFSWVL